MDSLRDILPRMMNGIGLRQRYRAELVILHWRQIVGEEIAANTRPGKIRRGVLTVTAKNAAWAHHLSMMKEEIAARINAFAGEKAVGDLKFQAGYFQNGQNQEKDDGEEEIPAVDWREGRLDAGELRAVEVITAPLADDGVRVRIKRLLSKDMALRKAQRKKDWRPCQKCGVLCPPGGDLCRVCAAAALAAGREAVRGLLRDAPWLGYEECSRYVACRRSDYNAARDELAEALLKAVGRDEGDRVKLLALTMLMNGVPPQAVSADMIEAILTKVRRRNNVSASRG